MIYKQHLETPSYLCDIDDHLHPWAAVRLCQEVTEYHGNATGIGFQKLVQMNHAWVLTRALYNIYRLPDAFEPIDLSTWSRGNNGLIAMRDYRMLAPSGEELLTGTSYWALIDMSTRHVVRLNNVISNYENHDILATEHAEIPKIKLPPLDNVQPALQMQIPFSMLDHTRHMNNSEYIKLIFDVLRRADFTTSQPFVLELNFLLESRGDELLTLTHTEADNSHYILISNPRGISVTARIAKL
jgi:acyl-ACP thioesterase